MLFLNPRIRGETNAVFQIPGRKGSRGLGQALGLDYLANDRPYHRVYGIPIPAQNQGSSTLHLSLLTVYLK